MMYGDLNIPPEILHAAYLVDNWMKEHGHETYRLGPIQSRVDPLQHIDILEHYDGKDGHRVWAGHASAWLYPGQAVAVIQYDKLSTQ